MFGLDILGFSSLLILAANTVQCTVPEAPTINIKPVSREIIYDYSRTSKELTQIKSGTVTPYAPGTDITTGGLREDRPETKIDVSWGIAKYPQGVACLWYDEIKITIELQPKIYIAKEYDRGECRKAIMKHELKHVNVDRQVINKYAQEIGLSVQNAVNAAGALGPYNLGQVESVQKKLMGHVESAVETRELLLYEEMSRRQNAVDSLEEYERVSAICDKEERKTRHGHRRR